MKNDFLELIERLENSDILISIIEFVFISVVFISYFLLFK